MKQVKRSTNKIKTTWTVIRENTGKTSLSNEITEINLETGSTDDINKIAYAFNNFFLSAVTNLDINHSDPNTATNLTKKSYPTEITESRVIPSPAGDAINVIVS
jgi:hypothetical protein